MSQQEFAEIIRVSHTSLYLFFYGIERPGLDTLTRIIRNLRFSNEEQRTLLAGWNYGVWEPILARATGKDYSTPRLMYQQDFEIPRSYQPQPKLDKKLLSVFRRMNPGQTVVVYGLPGIGKSTLMRVIGEQPIMDCLFEGGILYAPMGPGAVPVRQYLGKWYFLITGEKVQADWDDEFIKLKITQVLNDRQVLIWVDNVSNTDDLTQCQLAGSRACFLATSRRKYLAENLFAPATNKIEVGPLTTTQSRALLYELLKGVKTEKDQNITNVVDLCHGVPLMLEWAASAIRLNGWNKFMKRLSEPQDHLYLLSFPTPEKPAHSLLLTLSMIYDALSGETKKHLHELRGLMTPGGSKPYPLPLELITQYWNLPSALVQRRLNEMVDDCLIKEVETDSYVFQPFVSEFLTAIADDETREEIMTIQAEYLRLVQARQAQWEQPRDASIMKIMYFDHSPRQADGSWQEQFATLRVSAQLAAAGALPQFLNSHLLTVEYLARYYPAEGVTWARQAFEATGSNEPLERAVMAQLYGWLLNRTEEPGESRLLLRLALADYEQLDDWHGQVACALAIEEKVSGKTRRLLDRLARQPALTHDDANLLLHAAGRLRKQDETRAEGYFQNAQAIYQQEVPTLNPNLLRRVAGWPVEPFDEAEENRYWKLRLEVDRAIYCHRLAWEVLRFAYRAPDREIAGQEWLMLSVLATPDEENMYSRLAEYGRRLIQALFQSQVSNPEVRLAQFLILHLYKRGLSSPAALYASLQRRRRRLWAAQQQRNSAFSPQKPAPELAHKLAVDQRYGLSPAYEVQLERLLEEVVFEASLSFELEMLAQLLTELTPLMQGKSQLAKVAELRFRLNCADKFVVITRYLETQVSLKHQLLKFCPDMPMIQIDASLSPANQQILLEKFEQAEAGILLTTDTLAPGLRYSVADCEVIYYDLPWNKIRFDQWLKHTEGLETATGKYLLLTHNSWEPLIAKKVIPNIWFPPGEKMPDPQTFDLPGAEQLLQMILDGNRQIIGF